MDLKRRKNIILYLITIAFWSLFYYFLPLAGDDWAWGSNLGLERLKNAFDGYNGRYIGNLLIILITRSVAARILVCSLTMFMLVFILSKILNSISKVKDRRVNYIISFSSILLLVLPNQISFNELQPFQIFGSTVGWLSGFTNYVVPSVLILIFYYFVTCNELESKGVNAILFFVGIIACLCVEHYTLFSIIFSFSVVAYKYYHYKRICKKSVCFFFGSLVGALIMFSNSSYFSMQKGEASKKQRAVGLLGSFKQYGNYVFGENANNILVISFDILLFLAIASFLAFFAVKVYKAVMERNVSKLLPMICLVTMTLPLLFTNSGKEIYIVAPRCYFLQYFMIVIYVYRRYAEKNNTIDLKKLKRIINASFVLLLLITSILYCCLDYMGIVRDNAVNEAIEKNYSTVEVIEYPKNIEHIQWSSNFITKDTYLERYKNFKNISNEKELKIVSFEK